MNREHSSGMALALAATFLWSTTFLVGRHLFANNLIDAGSLVFYRFLIGALFTFAIAGYSKEKLLLDGIASWKNSIVIAFFLYFLMSLLLFYGQKTASATTASIFLESLPAIIMIIIELVHYRKIDYRKIAVVALGLVGCVLVLNVSGKHADSAPAWSVTGLLALLGGAIAWVAGTMLSKGRIPKTQLIAFSAWTQLFAALLMLMLQFILPEKTIVPTRFSVWMEVLYMGIFPTALAFIAWNKAIQKLDLWLLLLTQNTTPIFTVILAGFFLHEQLSWTNFFGMVLVLGALTYSTLSSRHPKETP